MTGMKTSYQFTRTTQLYCFALISGDRVYIVRRGASNSKPLHYHRTWGFFHAFTGFLMKQAETYPEIGDADFRGAL